MGPKIKVHPMCQAMARTQLKYVTLAHDGVNAVLSTTQVPLPTPRPFSVETGVLHYHESTCSCKPTLPRGSGGCSCNSFKLAPTQDPPTISFGTDSPKYDLGGSSPVFKTVPSGQTQTVLTDLNSPKNLAENVIQIPNCRKCGGEPMLRTHDNRFIRWSWVECTGCPCRTNVAGSDFQAIQEWKRGDVICDKPAAGESEVTSTTASTSSAVESFRQAIRANSSLAWSWHCNIAVLLQDHGMSHEASNRCTADVMLRLFDIDVTVFDEWNLFHWATPSAAVGASRPVDDVTEWCDGAKEFCERQVESDTVPRAEYDRVVKLNHHLREVCVMAIVERVPDDSKSTNAVSASGDGSGDTVPRAEYDRVVKLNHHFRDVIAEYHDMATAESPDDWVILRDPNHVIRECDWLNHRTSDRWTKCLVAAGHKIHNYPDYNFRCRRKDLPPVPVVSPALPSPWRPMTEQPPVLSWMWVATKSSVVYMAFMNDDKWPSENCVAWIPIEKPIHPNATPPVVPKTRTVTLREYHTRGYVFWSSDHEIDNQMGRTVEAEVPE